MEERRYIAEELMPLKIKQDMRLIAPSMITE